MSKDSGGSFLGGMAVGLLLGSSSGSGGSKPSGGAGDPDGCGYLAIVIPFTCYVLYSIYEFGDWLCKMLVECWPTDLYIFLGCLPGVAIIWFILRANKKAVARQRGEQYDAFMADFNLWEQGVRAEGDETRYCPVCRGKCNRGIGKEHGCQCRGTGIRNEPLPTEFLKDFLEWEMSRKAEGDETKYCMYCRGKKIVRVEQSQLDEQNLAWFKERRDITGKACSFIDYDTGVRTDRTYCLHCNGTGLRT